MTRVTTRAQIRVKTVRRMVLALLAAVAVTAGSSAASFAGTADAGAASGGVIQGR